jgi:microcystin-dependent protein
MSNPFLSEIRIMSFNFAPRGWAQCNGQLLPINQNQALFSLLGTTYGGNGQTTFALPDLRSRLPIHMGSGHTLGERAGEEAHTINISELAAHSHPMSAKAADALNGGTGRLPTPAGTKALAEGHASQGVGVQPVAVSIYGTGAASGALAPATIGLTGGSQPHTNIQPYLTLNFCIALQGIFPSQN